MHPATRRSGRTPSGSGKAGSKSRRLRSFDPFISRIQSWTSFSSEQVSSIVQSTSNNGQRSGYLQRYRSSISAFSSFHPKSSSWTSSRSSWCIPTTTSPSATWVHICIGLKVCRLAMYWKPIRDALVKYSASAGVIPPVDGVAGVGVWLTPRISTFTSLNLPHLCPVLADHLLARLSKLFSLKSR